MIQFHGDEDDDFCRRFDRPYLKAVRVQSAADIQTAFHAHRMKQAQQSRLLNMLAVEIQPIFNWTMHAHPTSTPPCTMFTTHQTTNRFSYR